MALTVTAGQGTIAATWTAVSGATGYRISNGVIQVDLPSNTLSHIFTGLSDSTQYTVTLKTLVYDAGESATVTTPSAPVTPPPNTNPTGVKIVIATRTLNGTNVTRGVNELIRYIRTSTQTVTPTNQYGVEVTVNETTGKVIAVIDRLATNSTAGTPIPSGSYVLSGHGVGSGYAGTWLLDNAKVGAVVELTGGTVTPPSTNPPPPVSSGTWLSGGAGPENANGSFGTWRGEISKFAATWVNTIDMWTLQPGFELANWDGAIDLAANVPDWQGWAAEAAGIHDGYWRAFGQNLKKYRGNKSGTTYMRIYHEGVGGAWYPWSVFSADLANFKTAWVRTAEVIRSEFPQVKMMLGAAAASGGARVNVADAWPNGVDVLSIDTYNEYPWVNTVTTFTDKMNNGAGNNSPEKLRLLAQSKGVPVVVSEWGNASAVRPASSGGGGDAPVYIEEMNKWFKANAGTGPGQILADAYFNITGYAARFELYTGGNVNSLQPNAAAKYRSLTWG